jgi:hypothetical protein
MGGSKKAFTISGGEGASVYNSSSTLIKYNGASASIDPYQEKNYPSTSTILAFGCNF